MRRASFNGLAGNARPFADFLNFSVFLLLSVVDNSKYHSCLEGCGIDEWEVEELGQLLCRTQTVALSNFGNVSNFKQLFGTREATVALLPGRKWQAGRILMQSHF